MTGWPLKNSINKVCNNIFMVMKSKSSCERLACHPPHWNAWFEFVIVYMRKQNDSRKSVLAIHATITQIGQTKTVLATHATFTWAVDRYRQEYMFKNWPYTNTWAMNRTRDRGTEKKQLFKSHFTWAVGRYREKHIDVCHAAQQVMYVMPPNRSFHVN